MNIEFRWIKGRSLYIATASTNGMDHHFECDPKVLLTEELWWELMKLIADFLADKGIDTKIVKAKLQIQADVYLNKVIEDESEKQDPTASGPDHVGGPGQFDGPGPLGEPIHPDFDAD